MKKTRKFTLAAAILGGATLSIALSQIGNSAIANIGATTETPTIHMDETENYLFESVVGIGTVDGSSTVKTAYGNAVAVEYVDFFQMRTTGNWHQIEASGYFGNTDKITGLSSLSFIAGGSGTIEVSWSTNGISFADDDKQTFSVSSGTTYTCSFNNESPNYFRFKNAASNRIPIVSIDIDFSCVNLYPAITVASEDPSLGSVSVEGDYKAGGQLVLTATPITGASTFSGWYWDGNLVSLENPYTMTVPSYEMTIVGNFEPVKYNVVAVSESSEMGSVVGSGDYSYNSSVTVTATPNEGYNFVGWYDGETQVSTSAEYSFTMPMNAVNLSAKFEAASFYVNLRTQSTSMGTVSGSGYYDYKSTVTIEVTSNAGYTFQGWFEDDALVSSLESYKFEMPARALTYTARWTVNTYAVNVTAEYVGKDEQTSFGMVEGAGTYAYLSEQKAVATPYDGFAFLGWYEGETLVGEELEYTFTMPAKEVSLVAKFSKKFSVTLTVAAQGVTGTPVGTGEYGYMEEVTVSLEDVNAETPFAIDFYDSAFNLKTSGTSYTFTMPEEDVNLYWAVRSKDFASVTSLYFGNYPQTCVKDETLISNLSTVEDTDGDGYIEYEGTKYLKTYSESYAYGYDSEGNFTIIYFPSTTYYFEIEPIAWKYYGGMLMAEKIIDASVFYTDRDNNRTIEGGTVYPNNYEYSTVRAYLNGYNGSTYEVEDFSNKGFIDKAFTETELGLIESTMVDNSVATTNRSSNPYACNNTADKIFLLSYQDARNADYGYSTSTSSSDTRVKKCTDYAIYRGIDFYSSSTGAGYWWLRSPGSGYSDFAWSVISDGGVSNGYVRSCSGLSPAMNITL